MRAHAAPGRSGHPGVRAGADRRQGDPCFTRWSAHFNADFDGDQMAVHVPCCRQRPAGSARAIDVDQHPVARQR
ncbi:MAG: hypothetical protein H6924_01350 [Alphaproteobacteria bacterium]|nr:hypothetical protein [Alphaproteobacteria bacterium]